jgi:hypothetical protein
MVDDERCTRVINLRVVAYSVTLWMLLSTPCHFEDVAFNLAASLEIAICA